MEVSLVQADSRGGKNRDQNQDQHQNQGIRKGKGRDRGTGIEGSVNRDAPVPHQPQDRIPDRIPDRVYGDLNGFPESSDEFEPVGGGGGPGLPGLGLPPTLLLLTGTTAASGPAVLRDRVSEDTGAPEMPNGGVERPAPESGGIPRQTPGPGGVKLANGGLHIGTGTRAETTTTTTIHDWPDSDSDYSDPDSLSDPGTGQENGVGCGKGCGAPLVSQSTQDSRNQDSRNQDSPIQDFPNQDSPIQDSPIQDSPIRDSHIRDSHIQDSSNQDSPNQDSPIQATPNQDSHIQDSHIQESPIQDSPIQDSPNQDSPNQDSPTQVSPNQDSPIQDSPNQDSPSQSGSSANPPGLDLPVRPQTLRTNPALVVSLSCDATPLSPEDEGGFYFQGGYEEDFRGCLEAGRRQSAPDQLPDRTGDPDCSDTKLMPKRFGIAEFFTRSLFSRKSKEPKALSHNASGWRLFGKTNAADGDSAKDPASIESTEQCLQGEEPDSGGSTGPQVPAASARRKNLEFEPLSTTALILEDRPANLPAKSLEETQRHKMEYEEMVAGAKRRELKEAQKKKRQMKERHRQEDSISNAMIIWNNEILPHWDTMKGTRRVRELWWQGLPPSVRGRVWSLAIGNELNITPELYEIFLSRAKEKWRSYSETSSVNDSESDGGASLADRESSLDLIKLDISRTFPSLFIFQKGGPYHDLLHSVLGAYTCYRPDIGYVQGMSFIAAVLILNLEEAEAFITFANLLNKPCQMAFFRVDHELMLKYFSSFEVFFEENLPRLFSHFQTNNLTPDLYLIDWIFTLYSKSLPLDVACRVWDVFCRDGEESLFRTGLGILRLFEDVLLQMDFIHIAQFLTRLPEDLQPHTLFNAMASTQMLSRNRRWPQVFSSLMKDGVRETDKSSSSSPALRS